MKKANANKRGPRKRALKKQKKDQSDSPRIVEAEEDAHSLQALQRLLSSGLDERMALAPLPEVSAIEIASIAAILLPKMQGGEESACRSALKLIRVASRQLNEERDRQEGHPPQLPDPDHALWARFSERVEGLYKNGELNGKPFHQSIPEGSSDKAPFPISIHELCALVKVNLSAGRKRLAKVLKSEIEVHPDRRNEFDPLTLGKNRADYQDAWDAIIKEGIDRNRFMMLSREKSWKELPELMDRLQGN